MKKRQSHEKQYLEITTVIPCPVKCLRYCPQEVLEKKYTGTKVMDIETFTQCLGNVPKDVTIAFAGYSEPFANKDCIEFIELAHKQGHPLHMFTTLAGASREDTRRLLTFNFDYFCLHIPDGEIMKMPQEEEYKDNFFKVVTSVRDLRFSYMNDLFYTNNRENIARGSALRPRRFGHCYKISSPQPVLLPSGDVYLCCMDFGLKHHVGNLLTEDFDTITARIRKHRSYELCRTCSRNLPLFMKLPQIIIDQLRRNKRFRTWAKGLTLNGTINPSSNEQPFRALKK